MAGELYRSYLAKPGVRSAMRHGYRYAFLREQPFQYSAIGTSKLTIVTRGSDERNNEMVESDERVTACGDGTFCCGIGPGQISCCSQGNGVWLVDGITTMKTPPRATKHPAAHSTLPSSSSSSLKSSITTSILSRTSQPSSTTSIPTSPPYSTSSTHSFGVGPLVSVILGSVLLAFLLVSAGIYIFRRRRKRRLLYAKQEPSVGDSIVILDVDGSTPSAPTEMEMQWSVQEIDGRVRPPEWEPNARNELPGPKEGVVWVDRRRNAVMRMGF